MAHARLAKPMMPPVLRPVRCDHCDEAVGRNEPILIIDGEHGHWTTLSAERISSCAEVFHRVCFETVRDSGTVSWLRGV